jgi:hypothetical protein
VNYDINTIPQQLIATLDLVSALDYDEHASLVQSYAYSNLGGYSMGNTLHYTKAVGFPNAFKPFTDIPHSSDTLRIGNFVTVYKERTLRVPRVLSWCSSLTSMGTFYSYQHQRYVM